MTRPDEPAEEAATRGGYVLPPAAGGGDFVGPADDPDRYQLAGPGKSGGEGTTWRAHYHGRLQSPLPLAIKRLHPRPGASADWPTAAELGRWQDQAALLRHLRLDHLVRVHEVFTGPPPHEAGKMDSGVRLAAYLVMEWVEGQTLRELCKARQATRESIPDLLRYVAQAAATLEALASATRSAGNPSLHRDIKPANCIINDERGLVLIDISTLRLIDDGFDPIGLHTPQYTAPEVRAAPHLPRSTATDVYSIGALAAFCLTGRDPAPGGDLRNDLLAAARHAEVAKPDELAALIMTTLAEDPGRRPQDLPTWSGRLVELGRAVRAPTLAIVIAAVAAVTLAGSFLIVGPPEALRRQPAAAGPQLPASSPAGSAAIAGSMAGTIVAPTDGSGVKQCAYFSGEATVPPGYTLILVMQNLNNGDAARYAQDVFGWDDPQRLPEWRGAQYFGDGDDTVGQNYRVDLMAATMEAVRRWNDSDEPGTALAATGVVLDQVEVTRVAGAGPGACEGPP